MASLRKASSYSRKPARPYTRVSKNKSKAYIKQVPHNKVVRYAFGNTEAHNLGKLKYTVKLISGEGAQIRDNAIESSRMLLVKILDQEAPKQYYFAIKIYPHHILRNNKTAAGAGADRLSSGMRHSFGIIEGRAAIVHPGKEIFYIACENEKSAKIARDAMTKVKSKLPCKSVIRFERL